MLRKLLMLLIPVLAFGCAGNGTFEGSTSYVGSYSGTWTCPANGHTGTMTLSISPHASILGTYVDTTANVSGPISGMVAQSGSFSASVAMSSGATKMSGQFSITSPGSAGAVLAGNATVGAQAITFTLPADTSSGNSPYAGSFSGNWTSASNGHYGTLTMTISDGSNIQGALVDAVAGTTGSLAGAVTETGSFTTTVTLSTGTEAFSGQLSINTGVLSGNGNISLASSTEPLAFTLSTASATTSAYSGSFTGAWNSATNGHSGQISWTISPEATIIGTYVDTTAGIAGSISGTVDTSGNFSTTILFATNTSYPFAGTLTLLGSGTTTASMSGNGTLNNGAAQAVTFSLPATPTVSTYQGTFSGAYLGQPFIGNGIVWTVGPNGTVVGLFEDPNLNTDNLYGSVDNNGDLTLKVILNGNVIDTIGGQMTYQVLEPPTGSTQPAQGNEVGEGTITPAGGTAQPFSFNLVGTINNVTSTLTHKAAAKAVASPGTAAATKSVRH